MPPTPQTLTPPLRVAVAGLGAIGLPVVTRIAGPGHGIPGISLASVSARDLVSARARLDALGIPPNVACLPLEQLAEDADVVIECVPAAHFTQVARPCLERGKVLVPLSVGKLLEWVDSNSLACFNYIQVSNSLTSYHVICCYMERSLRSLCLDTRNWSTSPAPPAAASSSPPAPSSHSTPSAPQPRAKSSPSKWSPANHPTGSKGRPI